ncbi:hypothetical protein B0H63DRAFT_469132 [Podospora didyma]|uniref:Uncharacterized protein n=1 Tax=Podospora didyma TaxID=330526 RepID=A0AAE0NT92_9PEZI|nr:hypothetical protein B0H63DRAFT_469132 [Podospora didyma]
MQRSISVVGCIRFPSFASGILHFHLGPDPSAPPSPLPLLLPLPHQKPLGRVTVPGELFRTSARWYALSESCVKDRRTGRLLCPLSQPCIRLSLVGIPSRTTRLVDRCSPVSALLLSFHIYSPSPCTTRAVAICLFSFLFTLPCRPVWLTCSLGCAAPRHGARLSGCRLVRLPVLGGRDASDVTTPGGRDYVFSLVPFFFPSPNHYLSPALSRGMPYCIHEDSRRQI